MDKGKRKGKKPKSDTDATVEFKIEDAVAAFKDRPSDSFPTAKIPIQNGRKHCVEGEPAEPLSVVAFYGPFEGRGMQYIATQFGTRVPEHTVLQYMWEEGVLKKVEERLPKVGYAFPNIILVTDDLHTFWGSLKETLEGLVSSARDAFPNSYIVGVHSPKPVSTQGRHLFQSEQVDYAIQAPQDPTKDIDVSARVSEVLAAYGQSMHYDSKRKIFHAGNVGLVPVKKSDL